MQVHRKPSWELAFTDLTTWGVTVAHQHLKKWLKLTAELKSRSRISQIKLWKKKPAATQGGVKTDTEIIQAWTKPCCFLEFSSCFVSNSSRTWSCSVTTIQWSWILCASPFAILLFYPSYWMPCENETSVCKIYLLFISESKYLAFLGPNILIVVTSVSMRDCV